MKLKSKIVLLFSIVVLALSTMACEKEGGAEKAGKEIDKAYNSAKDKVNEATK